MIMYVLFCFKLNPKLPERDIRKNRNETVLKRQKPGLTFGFLLNRQVFLKNILILIISKAFSIESVENLEEKWQKNFTKIMRFSPPDRFLFNWCDSKVLKCLHKLFLMKDWASHKKCWTEKNLKNEHRTKYGEKKKNKFFSLEKKPFFFKRRCFFLKKNRFFFKKNRQKNQVPTLKSWHWEQL